MSLLTILTHFQVLSNSGTQVLLAYNGNTAFSSTEVPSGDAQETIYIGSNNAVELNIVIDDATA
jgi:hypothetical protein